MARDPVAFLLNPKESNGDDTNYWIFSETGLRRLLDRTGWDICHFATSGSRFRSNPASGGADQRAFCLLRSKRADPWVGGAELTGGWHDLETDGWRWTEPAFSAITPANGATLRFDFTIPPETIEQLGCLRLRALVDGAALPWAEFRVAGPNRYTGAAVCSKTSAALQFEVDGHVACGDREQRRIAGIQVVFWEYEDGRPVPRTPIAME